MSMPHDFNATAGLEVFGTPVLKKNKGIISRMKRSLSSSGRPPSIPLKFPSESDGSQQSVSSITSHSSSPTPSGTYFRASPTTHLSYETFSSSSTSSLSIHSFPTVPKRPTKKKPITMNTISKEKLQAKSMFESRFIQNEEVSLTKLISIESNKATQVAKDTQRRAPAPAMYWSCPQIYGDIPPKIRAHASVVLGDKMFVFGGTSKTLCSDTLYVLELDTFTWYVPMVFGTAPPPCRAHCLCADNTLGKIYLFGGGDGQKYHNHLYILDTSTMNWTRPKTTGEKPSERRAHVTALWKDWLYVFGGGNGTRALNDVYRLNLKTREWESVHPTGIQPISRGYHTGTLVGNKWIIFGGSDGKECFGGIHVLDLETECWFPVQLDPQMPRLSHSAICVGSFLFVFAGHDGAKYCNDLLMLNLVNMTWETKVVYGQAPTPRGYHTTVLYDSRIYLFGGYNGTSFSSDVYILDLSSYAYLPQIMNFEILH